MTQTSFSADPPGPLLEGDEQIANEPAVDLVGEAAIDVELGLSRADKHFGFVQGMHVATSDFDGDGYSDILWQNTSGEVAIWEMNWTSVIGGGDLGNPGPSWHTIATGDFNGDRHSDILWQNTGGEVVIWEMNGTTVIGGGSLGNPGPNWHVIATGDFNGDGHSDIPVAEHQRGGGDLGDERDQRGRRRQSGQPGAELAYDQYSRFDGDRRSDILWQNTSGAVVIWEMNGTSVIGGGSLGNPGSSWHPIGK